MDRLNPRTPERDWRNNPVPGDEARTSRQWRRVEDVTGNGVVIGYILLDGTGSPIPKSWKSIRYWSWRKWAATAEVIKRGDV